MAEIFGSDGMCLGYIESIGYTSTWDGLVETRTMKYGKRVYVATYEYDADNNIISCLTPGSGNQFIWQRRTDLEV